MKNIEEAMKGSIVDYAIASIAETQIMDVYEYKSATQNDEAEKPEYEQETEV